MSLEKIDVERIAQLARLEIAPADMAAYAQSLSDILAFVASMNEVGTDDVEPMAHPLDVAQRLREDVVTETNRREEFQAIAPRVEAGLYLVPRVIE
ncbi:MAG: Asp-tRNA(Asn)/Glu-tRNA(Gln) amidotransferase subunit GatC [Gammaproteobacteria bacterium]|jgi:aspartyl-tRNA(Asn)/glutamyl-tRNA(Gln) amidotransferase subunit C|nr:Asp-tRNA(Asn)/Glu-tRNA(Gln) amidotransferase subunit GatC [Gammaproteobacteria bacterium]